MCPPCRSSSDEIFAVTKLLIHFSKVRQPEQQQPFPGSFILTMPSGLRSQLHQRTLSLRTCPNERSDGSSATCRCRVNRPMLSLDLDQGYSSRMSTVCLTNRGDSKAALPGPGPSMGLRGCAWRRRDRLAMALRGRSLTGKYDSSAGPTVTQATGLTAVRG